MAPSSSDDLAVGSATGTGVAGSHKAPTPASTPESRPPRRRRRWLRTLVSVLIVLVLLLTAGTIGAGWYFSSQLLVPDHSVAYDVTVSAVDGDQLTLTKTSETLKPIVLGLAWPDGYAVVDRTVRTSGESVVRTVIKIVRGSLRPGLAVYADRHAFTGDPKTARGLDFSEVTVPADLGPFPAWFVPPTAKDSGTTWVVAVHGRGEDRQEMLRMLPSIADAGLSTLAITYRNDLGAPGSQDGLYHLGDTEWSDVRAAVSYAREHGATGIVLYGISFGGGTVMTALRRMPADEAALIRAVVLDSPAMDWSAVIDMQAEQRGLPGVLTWTAKQFVEYRADLSLSDVSQGTYAPALRVPVLMYVDEADTRVPPAPSLEFARARPDLVTLVVTNGADHTGSWNFDSTSYESALSSFLHRFR